MRKLFGTDGIRGKANTYPITPEMALFIGKATAAHLGTRDTAWFGMKTDRASSH